MARVDENVSSNDEDKAAGTGKKEWLKRSYFRKQKYQTLMAKSFLLRVGQRCECERQLGSDTSLR
jgi:hypothetical protein